MTSPNPKTIISNLNKYKTPPSLHRAKYAVRVHQTFKFAVLSEFHSLLSAERDDFDRVVCVFISVVIWNKGKENPWMWLAVSHPGAGFGCHLQMHWSITQHTQNIFIFLLCCANLSFTGRSSKIGIFSFAIGFLQFKCIILSDYMLWRKKTKKRLTLHTSKHIFYSKSLLGFWVCKSATAMPTKTMWKFQWWVCHRFHTLWLVVWSLVCMPNILGKVALRRIHQRINVCER